MVRRLKRGDLRYYAFATLLVGAATIFTSAVTPLFEGRSPLIFFTLAVLLAAAYGGVGAGLLATVLSMGVLVTLENNVMVLVMSQSSLALFGVLGVAISLIIHKLHRMNDTLGRTRDELKVANDKLARQTQELSQSNEEWERFGYAIAHDLRAPLRVIRTRTEMALARGESTLDRDTAKLLHHVASAAGGMDDLLQDLLELAKFHHEGKNGIEVVDAALTAELARQGLEEAIKQSKATISISPLPAVQVHEPHLLLLFQNLLSNAIKYHSSDPPLVRISAELKGAEWIFSVKDNGIGIEPQYQHEIFQPLRRLHSQSEYEGTGLGLAICKLIVQRYNGRIWVESALGKGATFCFTLRQNTVPGTGFSDGHVDPLDSVGFR